jgi:hypothetical protein
MAYGEGVGRVRVYEVFVKQKKSKVLIILSFVMENWTCMHQRASLSSVWVVTLQFPPVGQDGSKGGRDGVKTCWRDREGEIGSKRPEGGCFRADERFRTRAITDKQTQYLQTLQRLLVKDVCSSSRTRSGNGCVRHLWYS